MSGVVFMPRRSRFVVPARACMCVHTCADKATLSRVNWRLSHTIPSDCQLSLYQSETCCSSFLSDSCYVPLNLPRKKRTRAAYPQLNHLCFCRTQLLSIWLCDEKCLVRFKTRHYIFWFNFFLLPPFAVWCSHNGAICLLLCRHRPYVHHLYKGYRAGQGGV